MRGLRKRYGQCNSRTHNDSQPLRFCRRKWWKRSGIKFHLALYHYSQWSHRTRQSSSALVHSDTSAYEVTLAWSAGWGLWKAALEKVSHNWRGQKLDWRQAPSYAQYNHGWYSNLSPHLQQRYKKWSKDPSCTQIANEMYSTRYDETWELLIQIISRLDC